MDSPMQGHTDEARGRFTSQHAHVVPGGVHAARVFGMGWGEAETKSKPSRCPALANFCYPSQAARPSLAFSWAGGARHQTTWQTHIRWALPTSTRRPRCRALLAQIAMESPFELAWTTWKQGRGFAPRQSTNTYAQSILCTAEKCFCSRPTPDPSEDPGSRPVRRRRALARCVYHGPFDTCFLAGVNVPTAPTRPSDVECLPFPFLMTSPALYLLR